MLDANLVLEDVEVLLQGHYNELCARTRSNVRVYETPAQPMSQPMPQPVAAQPSPLAKPANPLNQLVANVFVLVMLSVLEHRLAS